MVVKGIINNMQSNNQSYRSGVGQKLSGKYKLLVLDTNENIVWEQKDWAKNLILNQGMEALAPGALPTNGVCYANAMAIACMGSGERYNSIDVGFVATEGSGSCSGTTFTLFSGSTGLLNVTQSAGNGYSSAVAVGDIIKFSGSGEEIRVTAIGTGNTLTVTPSTTVTPAQPFTIWKTSQAGLQSVIHYAGSAKYFTGTGYCGTTLSNGVIQQRRSWDFSYETSSISVAEVGVGWSANGSNNLAIDETGGTGTTSQTNVFSRVLLPQTTSLVSGQKLRLIYELDITVSPYITSSIATYGSGVPFTASVGGSNPWPISPSTSSAGYCNIQTIYVSEGSSANNVSNIISSTGATQQVSAFLDPCNVGSTMLFWSESSASLVATGAGSNNRSAGGGGTYAASVTASVGAYSALSFTCLKNGTFDTSAGSTNIKSFGIQNWFATNPSTQLFTCLFIQPQTKTNVQTLTLTFQYTWGRTLA